MEVSFILVNTNTNDLLKECLTAIYKHTGTHSPDFLFEVIVVDNNSTENPQHILNTLFPKVKLIRRTINKGFGAANNQAIPFAKGKYIFFLNADAFLLNDAAAILANKMNDPAHANLAFCGGELLDAANHPNQCFGNFPTILSAISACGLKFFYPNYYRKHLSVGVANYDQLPKKVDYISGAALMTRRELVEKYGGFDDDFFLFFEETEWAWRLNKLGYYSMVFPEAKIIHLEGGSTETGSYKVFNERTFRLFAQSRQLFYKKTNGSFFAAIMKVLDMFVDLTKSLYHGETTVFIKKCVILWKA